MESLYDIQKELLDIFSQVEESDGEISDEQYDKLCITKENLKSKLDDYYKAIRVWSDEADSCKKEKARINNVQNKYKNRIERLKAAMLQAVINFGEVGKTNYFIELPTVKLFSKTSKSINEFKDRSCILIDKVKSYIQELAKQGILYSGDDVDLNGFLSVINTECKAEYGEDFVPFTMHDLTIIQLKISDRSSIADLLLNKKDLLNVLANSTLVQVENDTTKDEYKTSFDIAKTVGCSSTTIAEQVSTNTLCIR